MPKIIFLPHEDICPDGATIEVPSGTSICKAALNNGIMLEHACDLSCACTTCHVYIKEGYDSLEPPTDDEDDYLDKAWGLKPQSRLSCQAIIENKDLIVEIPKYTINQVSEGS
ncbi:MAG: ISC system 2Fe-2S type ferredoxin [Pseudomonadota bacterium]|nr:ISC system 2Fe-2S type ferredoxin [Pseudomonadota bacterium]|tara:strand:+ start:597 stop:935 length:339 start_codon:yes stop_codon:yes gene_type:complete